MGYAVLGRPDPPGGRRPAVAAPRRSLSEDEYAALEALCETVIPQPERVNPVPIAPWIDAALCEEHTSGTRLAKLPPMREAWRRGLAALDAEAAGHFGRRLRDCLAEEREALIAAVDAGEVDGPHWDGLPPQTLFREILGKEIVLIYYAHPAAWSEIGFGGPASPRGYLRLAPDRRDPWEARETDAPRRPTRSWTRR